MAAMDLLDGEAERLTRTAIELALAGDLGALRLCIERLLPVVRQPLDLNLCQTTVNVDIRCLDAGQLAALEQALVAALASQAIPEKEPEAT